MSDTPETGTHSLSETEAAAELETELAGIDVEQPLVGIIMGSASDKETMAKAEPILEEAGIHDVLAKSLGSSNAINVARATIEGLRSLQRPDEVAKRRGLEADEFVPKGLLSAYTETRRSLTAPAEAEG